MLALQITAKPYWVCSSVQSASMDCWGTPVAKSPTSFTSWTASIGLRRDQSVGNSVKKFYMASYPSSSRLAVASHRHLRQPCSANYTAIFTEQPSNRSRRAGQKDSDGRPQKRGSRANERRGRKSSDVKSKRKNDTISDDVINKLRQPTETVASILDAHREVITAASLKHLLTKLGEESPRTRRLAPEVGL